MNLLNYIIPIPAAQSDSSEWVSTIVTLLIIVFIFVGPLLKKITQKTRDKIAKDRGVEEPQEDDSKPEPTSPPAVAQSVMDEIADALRKKKADRDARLKAKAKAAAEAQIAARVQPVDLAAYEGDFDIAPSDAETEPEFALKPVVLDNEFEVSRRKLEKPAAYKAPLETVRVKHPVKHAMPAAALKNYLPPPPDIAVQAVKPIAAMAGVSERREKKPVYILDKMPARLSQNQKALLLADILGNPKSTEADAPRIWEL
jgi:hypothetical protein